MTFDKRYQVSVTFFTVQTFPKCVDAAICRISLLFNHIYINTFICSFVRNSYVHKTLIPEIDRFGVWVCLLALPAPRVSCFFQLPRTTTQTRFTGVLEATGCSTLSSRSMTTLCFPGRVFPVTAATRSTSFTRALLSGSSSTQTPLLFSGHRRSGAMITAVTQSCRVRAELWKLSASSWVSFIWNVCSNRSYVLLFFWVVIVFWSAAAD